MKSYILGYREFKARKITHLTCFDLTVRSKPLHPDNKMNAKENLF